MIVEKPSEGTPLRTRVHLPLSLDVVGHVSFLAVDILTNMILVCP